MSAVELELRKQKARDRAKAWVGLIRLGSKPVLPRGLRHTRSWNLQILTAEANLKKSNKVNKVNSYGRV